MMKVDWWRKSIGEESWLTKKVHWNLIDEESQLMKKVY